MKVLITYVSAGAGHRKAAEAVYDYLKNNRPDLELELQDALSYADAFFRFCYHSGYPFLVYHAVWLWGFFFWITEFCLTRRLSRQIGSIINYFSCRRFINYLKKENFDFIISTHFLNSELAANLKLKNKIKSRVVTVITDFGVHPFWVTGGTDIYVVASGATKDVLLEMGVEKQKIEVLGMPVGPNFTKVQDRVTLADKFGIEAKKFTVLLMTGSFGLGPLEKISKSLAEVAQVLVVCAKNKTLFERLQKQDLKNVKVFGFVNNAQELMAVSDVIVTKPGGSSIAELLNMRLFPVFITAIPGQEMNNVKILNAYGVGFAPKNIKQIKPKVIDLMNNPQELENSRNRIEQVARPFSCKELARVIC